MRLASERHEDAALDTYSGLQFNFLRSEFKLGTGAGTDDTGKIFLSCVRFTGLKLSGC